MIYLTADIHGDHTIRKFGASEFEHGKNLTKDDYMIILGDFGLLWKNESNAIEEYWRDWLSNKPWTTLVVSGNHENYNRINELPEVDMFNNKVKKYTDSIYIFNRGEVYNIYEELFFTMGGAVSIDKERRIVDITWWKEEEPSTAEYEKGLANLEYYNWKVDYIICHTCPLSIGKIYLDEKNKSLYKYGKLDSVAKYLDEIVKLTKFKKFYFGHFHDEWEYDKYRMLYNDIIPIGE